MKKTYFRKRTDGRDVSPSKSAKKNHYYNFDVGPTDAGLICRHYECVISDRIWIDPDDPYDDHPTLCRAATAR